MIQAGNTTQPSVVRRARQEDLQALSEVYVAAWQSAYRGIVPDAYLDALTSDFWSSRYKEQLNVPGKPIVGVLTQEGTVVGVTSVSAAGEKESGDALGAEWGEVISLYLRPECQGKGLGRMLFGWALEELRQQGFTHCVVWMMDGNQKALAFYQRMGFALDGAEHVMEIGGANVRGVRLHGEIPAGGVR